jgi:hypothetical protein
MNRRMAVCATSRGRVGLGNGAGAAVLGVVNPPQYSGPCQAGRVIFSRRSATRRAALALIDGNLYAETYRVHRETDDAGRSIEGNRQPDCSDAN